MDLFKSEEAFIMAVSNFLSALTILSCLVLKVPQIMYLQKRRCAAGIYVRSILMEITGFTIVTLYNFTNEYSVMTYLEYPIILVQIYVIMYYVLKFKGLLAQNYVALYVMFYIAFILSFACEMLPKDFLSYLIPLCTPLSGFAKLSYIYGIIQAGNADAVSLTTWVISVLTNLSRLFTVYVDSGDKKLMSNFFISACLSLGVLATAWMYKSAEAETVAAERRKSKTGFKESRHCHAD